jgi:hypothetical protein
MDRNIFLIPTQGKSSIFGFLGTCGFQEKLQGNFKGHHIYITSSKEETKFHDWCFEKHNSSKAKAPNFVDRDGDVWWLRKMNMYCQPHDPECKRIVLTDDPALIADGVQAVDREILEWFIENHKHSFVEVIKYLEFDANEEQSQIYRAIVTHDDFVLFGQATRLKNLGFNEPCMGYFTRHPHFIRDNVAPQKGNDEIISAPTWRQAFKWLRDEYGVHGRISPSADGKNFYYMIHENIFVMLSNRICSLPSKWSLHEQAESSCLDRLLDIVEAKLRKK